MSVSQWLDCGLQRLSVRLQRDPISLSLSLPTVASREILWGRLSAAMGNFWGLRQSDSKTCSRGYERPGTASRTSHVTFDSVSEQCV